MVSTGNLINIKPGDIIPIQSIQEWVDMKPGVIKSHHLKTKVQFMCTVCGRESTRTLFHKSMDFICSPCKVKQTMLKKYGVTNPSQAPFVKQKKKETALKHYGVENPMQCKEVVQTLQNNNLEKYGVVCTGALKSTQEKMKQTCLKKYGVDHFAKTPDYRIKCREAWGEKDNEELKQIENKRKQTLEEKYGNKNYNNREKFRETYIERYGGLHVSHNYRYEDQSFDSKWELAVWIWALDMHKHIKREPKALQYEFEGEIHNYYPDFEIEGTLVEVKGGHFFKEDGTMVNPFNTEGSAQSEAKHQCGLRNGVKFWSVEEVKPILMYVEKTYGEHYLQQFKIT